MAETQTGNLNLTALRKSLLWAFIVFLSLTALIAIFCVVSHDFGEIQIKVVLTTLTISGASICAMCCAAFIEKRGMNPFCYVGILSSLAAAILVIVGIWNENNSDVYWKATVTLIIIAGASAHTFLLLIPTLSAKQQWLQILFILFIGILAAQFIYAAWDELDNPDYYRWVAVVAILVGLLTLVIPICSKLRGKEEALTGRLILRKIGDNIYVDQSGRQLRVTEVEGEGPPAA